MVILPFCFWMGRDCLVSNGDMQVTLAGRVWNSEAGNVISTDSRGVKSFCCLS